PGATGFGGNAEVLQQSRQDDFMAEKVARNGQRRATVTRVVCVDRFDGGDDFLQGRKREESFAGRQGLAEAGLLRDDGASGGEVGGGAVAEPAAAQADVLFLGDGEFAARTAD